MGRIHGLHGIEIRDERPLAGRLTGVVYVVAPATVVALLGFPGVEIHVPWLVALIAVVAATWGVACLTVVDWMRFPGWAAHASTLAGVATTTLVTALTGAGDSPARLLLLL